MSTNITEAHRHAFEALTSSAYSNFALFSVFIEGDPAAAIVAVNECPPTQDGSEPEYEHRPLFVSSMPGMTITDQDGREA